MKIILSFILMTSLLFPVGGVVIFNDGTTIEGDVIEVNQNSVSITPDGLTFPENILMENIDSLKLYNGEILVANNKVRLLYKNGEFVDPSEIVLSSPDDFEEYDVEYEIVPNWSANLYTGYPILKASSFDYYDDINPVYGLSIGSPWGLFMDDFFMNVISEIAYYDFNVTNNPDYEDFGGLAFQIGLSPGFFIGESSVSLTACTGIYHAGTGFIGGGSFDIPLGSLIMDNFGDADFVSDNEDFFEALEMRLTARANLVQKTEGGSTGWLGAGLSFGYEF
ncbi:MAG: hypothetical protein CBC06_000780 [bacterium TMED46]|nr:MAG: hypothetical protein CBC06_000780 [bacterium TMED46]